MPLSKEQIDLIEHIDQKVKEIQSTGGTEISIILSLADEMPKIRNIINHELKVKLMNIVILIRVFMNI